MIRIYKYGIICFLATSIILSFSIKSFSEEKIIDTPFLVVSVFLVASTIYDIETTFAGIRNGAHEANPIMRPFVKSGRPATYAFAFGMDALAIGASYFIKKSGNKDMQKTWWLIPSFMATSHVVCGTLNLRYAW